MQKPTPNSSDWNRGGSPNGDSQLISGALVEYLAAKNAKIGQDISTLIAGIKEDSDGGSDDQYPSRLRQLFEHELPDFARVLIDQAGHFYLERKQPFSNEDVLVMRRVLNTFFRSWLKLQTVALLETPLLKQFSETHARELAIEFSNVDEVQGILSSIVTEEIQKLRARVASLAIGGHNQPVAVPALSGDNAFQRQGERYRVQFAGKEIFIENTFGARYLAILLGNINKSYSAVQLYAMTDHPAAKTGHARDFENEFTLGSTSDVKHDRRSAQEYRERLLGIREEREEAERLEDIGKIEALNNEFEFINSHLKKNTTRSGKPRPFIDENEKARLNVGKAIDRTLQRLKQEHPEFHKHLLASGLNSLGNTLCYRPSDPVSWTLQ